MSNILSGRCFWVAPNSLITSENSKSFSYYIFPIWTNNRTHQIQSEENVAFCKKNSN